MGFPIDITEMKDYINVENFTLDLLKSKNIIYVKCASVY